MFVPEVEFDQFIGFIDARSITKVYVGSCTPECDAEDAKIGIAEFDDPQQGAKGAVQEIYSRPRECFHAPLWRTLLILRTGIRRTTHRILSRCHEMQHRGVISPVRAVPANPIAVCQIQSARCDSDAYRSRTILENRHGNVIGSAGVTRRLDQKMALPVGRAFPHHDLRNIAVRNNVV
jgi:hypothetical protein